MNFTGYQQEIIEEAIRKLITTEKLETPTQFWITRESFRDYGLYG